MVKKILLFSALLLLMLKANAQIGLFRSSHIDQNVASENSIYHYDKSELMLSLFENGEYNLVLSLSSGDHHSLKQISFGTFTIMNELLFLRDDLFGFVMKMEFENNNCLKSVSGLSIIKGKCFVFSGTATIPTCRFDEAKTLLYENQESTNSAEAISCFPTGKYKDQPYGGYELDLLSHGRYEYNIDGFLISKGRWTKHEQLLVFYDDEISMPFFAPTDKEEKNVFLILGNPRCFALSIKDVPCQNGFYTLQDIPETILHLHDGVYVLFFDFGEGDIENCNRISLGSYVTDSGFITLHDSLLGYDTRMRIVSRMELMSLRKGYYGLRYKSFYWSKPSKYINLVANVNVEKMQTTCADFGNQDTLNPFSHNLYVCSNNSHLFDLFFSDKGLFQYKFHGMVLLEGSFKRIGNVLLLQDNEIVNPFYVLIEKDGLIPFLPGIFGLKRLKPFVENEDYWLDNPENYDWYIGK